MDHGRGFGLFAPLLTVQLLLLLLLLICIDQTDALKCELVGCRFCVTRRMQTHCSAFCATCPTESQRKEQSPSTLPISNSESGGAGCGSAPDYSPCLPLDKANTLFRECCEQLNLGTCIRLCHYDVTLNKAKHLFDNGICTVEMIPKYLYCASQGKDNSACCAKKGVFKSGGDRCQKFCNSAGSEDTITPKDISCASQLHQILGCHWSGLK
ncbi:Transcription factor [Trichinella spiralis]|uniref:Transcription factor n=2 Tax=Trichinella spiralis TaxID=6334 RepID=A0ABR3KZH6_TRISP